MRKFEVEYSIIGYGYATVYMDGDNDDLNVIYDEFSCNSFKDLVNIIKWKNPEVIDIEEVESQDWEVEDEDESDIEE